VNELKAILVSAIAKFFSGWFVIAVDQKHVMSDKGAFITNLNYPTKLAKCPVMCEFRI